MNKKRSLAELDNIIDEIISHNPEWVKEIDKIIKEQLDEDSETKDI